MINNIGKQFEKAVGKQINKLKDVAVIRLYDVTMGYSGINNPCDFILYKKPKMIMLECKARKGHLLNFKSDIRENQWEKLLEYSKIKGVEAGILVWFYESNTTYYIDIQTLDVLRQNGKKSFDCNKDIPTIILRGDKRRFFYDYVMDKFIEELLYE